MKRGIIIVTLLLSVIFSANAQTDDPVIVRLTSGVELRGHVKRGADGTVEIKTGNGDIFVYRENEILRITVDKEAKKAAQEEQRKIAQMEQERERQERSETMHQAKAPHFGADDWCVAGTRAFQKRNYVQAAECFRHAAELGDALAQNNLGYCYENGYGVPEDRLTAIEWYKKAAQQDNLFAKRNLERLGVMKF